MIGSEKWNTLSSDEKRNCIENHTGTHKLTVEVYRVILPDLKNEKGKPEMKKSAYQDALTRILDDESRREELFARINGDIVQTSQEITIHTPSDESSSSNKSTLYPQDTRMQTLRTEFQALFVQHKAETQAQLEQQKAEIDELRAMLKVAQMALRQQYPDVEEVNYESDDSHCDVSNGDESDGEESN